MFEEFFNKCEIQDPEKISEQQTEKIKATLQKRVADNSQPTKQPTKEENIMKTKSIRTIMIAAVAAVVGTIGIVGAASTILTREQIRDELAEKNSLTEEFQEVRSNIAENRRNNPGANPELIGEDPDDVHLSPFYEDVVVTELIVTEWDAGDYKAASLDDTDHGIFLRHDDTWGGVMELLKPDGNGGYLKDGKPIEDEKLLAAIAEGTEKYGDTFTIHY